MLCQMHFFRKKEKKKCPQGAAVLLHPIQCTCRKDAMVKAKKKETLPVIWIICFNQGFFYLTVMFSIQS